MKTVFFSCTRGLARGTPLHCSLTRLGIGSYQFAENNSDRLTSRYNAFLNNHAGEDLLAVFVHDDVTIKDMDVLPKLQAAATSFDIIGVVGASRFELRKEDPYFSWCNLDPADLSGAVEHTLEPGCTYWSSYGPVPRRCAILDGFLLAVALRKLGPIRFDERFAFHLYDIDFCLSCHQAQLTLGTASICCHHGSMGNALSDSYRTDLKAFWSKWQHGQRPEVPQQGWLANAVPS